MGKKTCRILLNNIKLHSDEICENISICFKFIRFSSRHSSEDPDSSRFQNLVNATDYLVSLEAVRQLFYGKNVYRFSTSGKCGYVLTNGLTHLNCLLNFRVNFCINFTINFSIKATLLAFGFAIDCQSLTAYNSLARIHMLELPY